ncbi:carbonic anhydrase [Sporolactobacillus sp. THM19-2]|uniref:beta-class carbonic anhydrase n=1 Tax=Sporolactobacillus sp. THM19-2 TaxID=2511171 RepID=UPI0010216CE2|nr:carbonic anhydrase [Sporolactobacillus sp. THM19-2]RYL94494.1 carbonic anhydrase [Sporolactobacillus sp. THM19-2]
MSQLENILADNKKFVENKGYVPFEAGGKPVKKMTVVTCMDCRLIELLPQALHLKNGDAIMIKSAGGMVEGPYSSVMKSILVSVYELGSEAVYIIGHTDCGMHGLHGSQMVADMQKRGVSNHDFEKVRDAGIQPDQWLGGFDDVADQVKDSVDIVKSHPLFPDDTPVYGLVIDPLTGELRPVA